MQLNTRNCRRDARISKTIRAAAGETGTNLPIEDIDGFDEPRIVMERRWTHETKTGKPIWHPSAYSRKGWSSCIYVGRGRRIVVGRGWIIANTEI